MPGVSSLLCMCFPPPHHPTTPPRNFGTHTPDRRGRLRTRHHPMPRRTVRRKTRRRVQSLPHPPQPQPLSHLCPLAYLSQPQPSRPTLPPPLRWPRLRVRPRLRMSPCNRTVIQTRVRRARRVRRTRPRRPPRAPRAPNGRTSSPGE